MVVYPYPCILDFKVLECATLHQLIHRTVIWFDERRGKAGFAPTRHWGSALNRLHNDSRYGYFETVGNF